MLHRRLLVSSCWRQKFSTSCRREVKVAVLGAAGGIGQPLSLLLKLSPKEVTGLVLYDIKHAVGVATDVSHIDSNSSTRGFSGPESLTCALESMEVVVIPAGVPRKPGMSRDDLFNVNASVVRDLVEACSTVCPQALIAIITNPVNTVVPIAAEVLKKHGVFDPRRLFGVTTLDLVRASTFVGNLKGKDPRNVSVPCIGGHSGSTIIPLLSQCKPKLEFKDEEMVALTKRIQNAGTEVVKAKDGAGSATLSMAYAAHRFVTALCRGLMGESNVVECAYVNSNLTEATFFSSPVLLGRCGIEKIYPLPPLSKYENELLKTAIPELKNNIKKGEEFMCQ